MCATSIAQLEQLFVAQCQPCGNPFRMDRTNIALNAAFAEVLRQKREMAGLTQEQLAEGADVSTRHVSFLETGKRQPTLSIMMALCAGLGVTLTEFSAALEQHLGAAGDHEAGKKLP